MELQDELPVSGPSAETAEPAGDRLSLEPQTTEHRRMPAICRTPVAATPTRTAQGYCGDPSR